LPPEISIPLVILIIILYWYSKRRKTASTQSVSSVPTYQNKSSEFQQIEAKIERLKVSDPNFSRVLFLDFVTSMYYKYYSNFSKKEFKDLKPFLSDHIYQNSTKLAPNSRTIAEIVIGNINLVSIFENNDYLSITTDINSNYTLVMGGRNTRFILTERWTFNRKKGLVSKGPEQMRDLKCPNCGAPSNFSDAGQCSYCETFIESGEMQWRVDQINILSQETFTTQGLGYYAQEVGTNYPTIVQPAIDRYINQFVSNHRLGDWNTYWANFTDNIVVKYFNEIYKLWSELKWEKVRHLLADRLYDSYNFWMENYKQQGLRNRLEKINIQRIDMAAVEVDQYYESFTVRIFANCFDYTETTAGKLIGGSKNQPRLFSEYWTFIRRTGVEKSESEFSLNNCPNCGAPADKMGQAAVCEYCSTKISNGDFSWVLARIVQDEEYTG
jgi:predicted lipid-binding transport protein (Tim44 family)